MVSLVEGGSELKKAHDRFCGDGNVLIPIRVLVTWVFQFVKIYLSWMYIYINIYMYV